MTTSDSDSQKYDRFTDVDNEPNKILPALPLSTSQSCQSLHEAVKPVEHLLDDLSSRVSHALNKCKSPKDGLTCDESAALYLYSLQWSKGQDSFYTIFNRALRDEDRRMAAQFQKYLNLFMSALNKLQPIQDRVWRGVKGDSSHKYFQGTLHVWWGASSCTDMVNVTDDFLGKGQHRTLFNIKCFNGKSIKNHSAYPNENETILPPGTYLRVKAKSNPTSHFHIVDMEQVEPTTAHTTQLQTVGATPDSSSDLPNQLVIIWCDSNVNVSQDSINVQKGIRKSVHSILETFEDIDKCDLYIKNQSGKFIILIISGGYGRQLVPKLHELPQLVTVFVYCMDKEANKQWSKDYQKVKAVLTKPDEIFKEVVREVNQSTTTLPPTSSSPYLDLGMASYLSPIKGFEKFPLMTLQEVLRPVRHLIGDTSRIILRAKEHCRKLHSNLTLDEAASIFIYTAEMDEPSLYKVFNSALRSEKQEDIKPWFPYLKLFMTAVKKLRWLDPSRVWCGQKNDLSANFPIASTGVWWNFTSAASSHEFVESFMLGSKFITLFSIKCRAAKDMSEFSQYPCENALLLIPGFSYKVTNQTRRDEHTLIIELIEIESAYQH